jgi:undecaprenyl-diphosphatase
VLAGGGALELWQVLLLGYAGGLLGDLLSYALGRRFHQNIRRLPGLRQHPEWLIGAELHFQRYGAASLLLGRFIGPLRPMLPMLAGMLDMPFLRFWLISAVAAAGWSVAYLLPGWATGAALRLPLPEGFWLSSGVIAAALGLLLAFTVQLSLRRQRLATPLTAWGSALCLAALMIGWPWLAAFDQGLLALVQSVRSDGLDRAMVLITRLGDFSTQLYCGALLCVLLVLLRQWRALALAIGTLLGTALANGLLKALFARVRPEVLLDPLGSYSFPSGHSSAAFAFFLCLGVLAGRGQTPRLRLTWLLLACIPATLIALSRVYLGVHWPSDVIAGALLAATLCGVSLAALQWRAPLAALPARAWWLILPACLALLSGIAAWELPTAFERYRY